MKEPEIVTEIQINYLAGLRNGRDELSVEMEDFALKNKVPILDWKAAELLEQIVLISKPERALEIGTAIGYSSIRIAKNLPDSGVIDTIELSSHNIPLAEGFIEKAGLKSKINLIKGDALKIIPTLKNKYDFIFLDSDKEDYTVLFNMALLLLNKGGVIFIDNLLWHGFAASKETPAKYAEAAKHIRSFNKLFCDCSALNSRIYPVGDGIGIGIKI